MNTEKRADLLKEKEGLELTVLNGVLRAAYPIVSWISAIQRLMYVCNQIDKSTPRPGKPTLVEETPVVPPTEEVPVA